MNDQTTAASTAFGHLNRQERLDYLHVPSDAVCDIQAELTRAQAGLAALTDVLESDPRRVLAVRDAPH
jgi:hypothetical protein